MEPTLRRCALRMTGGLCLGLAACWLTLALSGSSLLSYLIGMGLGGWLVGRAADRQEEEQDENERLERAQLLASLQMRRAVASRWAGSGA